MSADLAARVAELEESLQKAHAELQHSAEAGLELVNELEELKVQLGEAERERKDAERERDELHRQLRDKNAEIQDLKEENALALDRAGQQRFSIARSSIASLGCRSSSSDPGRRGSSSSMPQLLHGVSQGEHAMTPAANVEALEDEIQDLNTQITELEGSREKLRDQNEKLEAQMKEVRAEAEAEHQRIIEQFKKQEQQEEAAGRMTTFSSKMWEASGRAQRENLRKDVERLTSEQSELQEMYQESVSNANQLQQQLEKQLSELELTNSMLLRKETEVDSLQGRIASLEEELGSSKDMLMESRERLAEEQRKRCGDRGGKARLLTFALSEQMCDSDEDEDEEAYSQKSAEERAAEDRRHSAEAGLALADENEELREQIEKLERQKKEAEWQRDELQRQLHERKDAESSTHAIGADASVVAASAANPQPEPSPGDVSGAEAYEETILALNMQNKNLQEKLQQLKDENRKLEVQAEDSRTRELNHEAELEKIRAGPLAAAEIGALEELKHATEAVTDHRAEVKRKKVHFGGEEEEAKLEKDSGSEVAPGRDEQEAVEVLQSVRSDLLDFFGVDEVERSTEHIEGELAKTPSEDIRKSAKAQVLVEAALLQGDVLRVVNLSSKCRELLLEVLENSSDTHGSMAPLDPECISPEEEARQLKQQLASRLGVEKYWRAWRYMGKHLELHEDVAKKCNDLCMEVKSLREECDTLRCEPKEEEVELSWFEQLQQTLSCGSRGRQGPGD